MIKFFKITISLILALFTNSLLILTVNLVYVTYEFSNYNAKVEDTIYFPKLNYFSYLQEFYWNRLLDFFFVGNFYFSRIFWLVFGVFFLLDFTANY